MDADGDGRGGRRPETPWELTRDSLDKLLSNLSPDREEAGRQYERIRQRLIRYFDRRGIRFAEDLADETINRVARRIDEGVRLTDARKYPYFAKTALFVAREASRQDRKVQEALNVLGTATSPDEPADDLVELCLRACLARLPERKQTLLLEYYEGASAQARIRHRRRLAQREGISIGAMRIRVFRIRSWIEKCIEDCLGGNSEAEPRGPRETGGEPDQP